MRWGANLLQIPVPIALACSRAMVEEDFRAEMRGIEVPALLIHGDRDRSAPIELTGKPSAQLIPGCRFLIYEGAPHGLMFTHMDRLHADILQFVRETWQAQPARDIGLHEQASKEGRDPHDPCRNSRSSCS